MQTPPTHNRVELVERGLRKRSGVFFPGGIAFFLVKERLVTMMLEFSLCNVCVHRVLVWFGIFLPLGAQDL